MKSMTAYASVHAQKKEQSLQIAIRTLNFKYLDIAVRNLSAEDMLLEEAIKRQIKKRIQRGKVEVFVFLSRKQDKEIQSSRIHAEAESDYIK